MASAASCPSLGTCLGPDAPEPQQSLQGARIPLFWNHSKPPPHEDFEGSGTHVLACPLIPLLLLPLKSKTLLEEEESQCDVVERALEWK